MMVAKTNNAMKAMAVAPYTDVRIAHRRPPLGLLFARKAPAFLDSIVKAATRNSDLKFGSRTEKPPLGKQKADERSLSVFVHLDAAGQVDYSRELDC